MNDFKGRTAVLTGAASGFGLECARIAACEGMNVVMVDVQADALASARADQVQAHVLCPYFVPIGINASGRNRPTSRPPGPN